MRFLMSLVLLFPLLVLGAGCAGEQRPTPKDDPNWVDTTDPSKIVSPDEMKKGAPK
jgi:hypothetical protein